MNCDPIARAYRFLEYLRFGRELERCRFALLPQLSRASKVLMLGEGDGRFLCRLVKDYPTLSVDAFDISVRMIEIARQRLNSSGVFEPSRIVMHQRDATQTVFPERSYDLVVTHFFFDFFTNDALASLVDRVTPSLGTNAQWLVSEFDIPKGRIARLSARFWLKVMYVFFRFATGLRNQALPEWRTILLKAGFKPKERLSFQRGFAVCELWETATGADHGPLK